MKGNIYIRLALIISLFVFLFAGSVWSLNESEDLEDMLSAVATEELIRFHVLANSDTREDQQLKNEVKEVLVNYLKGKLSEVEDVSEAREIVLENMSELEELAMAEVLARGYDYSVTSEYGQVYFPTRMYGSTVFPAGEYETVRILIGEGKGENWWCVLFPPLCFVDATKGVVEKEEKLEEKADAPQIIAKFRVVEWFKGLFS